MTNKKGQGGVMTGLLIMIVVTVVILGIVYAFFQNQTSTTPKTGDTFTVSNTTCVQLTDDCFLSGTTTYMNGTTTIKKTNFTECKIGGDLKGTKHVAKKYHGKNLNASYTEVDCNYITDATSRTMLNFVPVLLAIAIFIGVAVYIK